MPNTHFSYTIKPVKSGEKVQCRVTALNDAGKSEPAETECTVSAKISKCLFGLLNVDFHKSNAY